jgi:hypothetical protein
MVAGNEKVRQFFESFLFTVPGERVNRPTYGAGAPRLVFRGVVQVEQTLRQGIQGNLTTELSDLVDITAVESSVVESTVTITVRYRLLAEAGSPGGNELQATFEQPITG